jgi:hypothetical protein
MCVHTPFMAKLHNQQRPSIQQNGILLPTDPTLTVGIGIVKSALSLLCGYRES